MRKLVLLYSTDEFIYLRENSFEIINQSHITFLTSNVNFEIMNACEFLKGFSIYDSKFSNDEIMRAERLATKIAENWYLDSNRVDLTLVDQFSIGFNFFQFLRHTFFLLYKYQLIIKDLIKDFDQVYISDSANILMELSMEDIPELKLKSTYLQLSKVSNDFVPSTVIKYKLSEYAKFFPRKIELRDIVKYFLSRVLNCLSRPNFKQQSKVLFVPAGKSQSLIGHYLKNKASKNLKFIFPANNETSALFSYTSYYNFLSLKKMSEENSNLIKRKVKQFYLENKSNYFEISNQSIYRIVEYFIFPNLKQVYSTYISCYRELKKQNPQLVILSAESHESQLIIHQAAVNLGIKTATMPHGITSPLLSPKYYAQKSKYSYKHALILTEHQRVVYENMGFARNSIYSISFYYFLQLKQQNILEFFSGDLKKVLILPPDYSDFTNCRYSINETESILDVCIDLKMEKICLKTRIDAQTRSLFIKNNKFHYRSMEIDVYTGYTQFINYLSTFDFAIGASSSATIEALLNNKPYFCYQTEESYIGCLEYNNIDDVLFIAKNKEELLYNILHKRIFKPGKSLDDLLSINQFKGPDEFFNCFENALHSIVIS